AKVRHHYFINLVSRLDKAKSYRRKACLERSRMIQRVLFLSFYLYKGLIDYSLMQRKAQVRID
ncbi:MAG TPA: hypothetical protein PK067_10850, partial [Kaistella chaponensis]|nr:hypothetical protein [Kaistella chaponensis]